MTVQTGRIMTTNYKIDRKIGTGAFGNVYLFIAGKSKEFALKSVNTLRLDQSEEECCREGVLMLKLCHTHLVHCYDAFMSSPYLYLIMELCSHGSLEQYLQRQKSLIAQEQICLWMSQMADVLRYLHALKVIHRDLKPANVFLDENKNVKLGDLGVARELDHTVQERQTSAGTLPYMSPEAFTGLPYNFKTDIWSMGCCIHEVMTLEKTFQGQNWSELHHMITSSKVPKMPPVYQERLRKLVLSLLNTDPSNRPDPLEILLVLYQIRGKRFTSAPVQPENRTSFDHRQICRAVKAFEMSSESNKILPLREMSIDDKPNVNHSRYSDDDDDDMHLAQGNVAKAAQSKPPQSPGSFRPLPMPKVKKKRKILRSLQIKQAKETISGENADQFSAKPDASTRSLSPPLLVSVSSSTSSSSSPQNSSKSETLQSPDVSPGTPDDWPIQYVNNLARDSIRWLRERFKPRDDNDVISVQENAAVNDRNTSGNECDNNEDDDKSGSIKDVEQNRNDDGVIDNSATTEVDQTDNNDADNDDDDNDDDHNNDDDGNDDDDENDADGDDDDDDDDDGDDDDDDDEESDIPSSGLVTLFTKSQAAVYINQQPQTAVGDDRKGQIKDLPDCVLGAAKNAVQVFQGQDPHLLKLMLIKILGLRGFVVHGQSLLQHKI